MKDTNDVLVTIAILTYNSEKFILDSLNSTIEQTYKHLELIICDDCSKDNTIPICENWLMQNRQRFTSVKLLKSEKNQGISPNRNRCIRESSAKWIKFLDSDDLLAPNSIQSLVGRICDGVNFVMGNYISFNEYDEREEHFVDFSFFNLDAENQLKSWKNGFVALPALFLNKEALLALDCFDERFPMLEDYPLFLKALENGYKFDCVNDVVVYYRDHSESIQLSKRYRQSHALYVKLVLVPKYKAQKKYIDYWHDKLFSNKEIAELDNHKVKAFLIKGIMLLTDPKEWYYIIQNSYRSVVFKIRKLKK